METMEQKEIAAAEKDALNLAMRLFKHPLMTAEQQEARWREQAAHFGWTIAEMLEMFQHKDNATGFSCKYRGRHITAWLSLNTVTHLLICLLAEDDLPRMTIERQWYLEALMQAVREDQLIYAPYYRAARELIEWQRGIGKCP